MNLKIKFKSNDECKFIRDNIRDSQLVNDDINKEGYFYIYYVPVTNRWVSISRSLKDGYLFESSLKGYVDNIITMEFEDFFSISRTKKINDILYG